MSKFVKNYSLSISLLILFILSWALQAVSQYYTLKQDAIEHNQELNPGEFIADFTRATAENWQSEFLQLLSFVVLSSYFIHKGSPQSKDGDEELKKSIDQIKRKLKIS